jgi:hypothetical protein
MMTEWVLLLIFVSAHQSPVTIDVPSREVCERIASEMPRPYKVKSKDIFGGETTTWGDGAISKHFCIRRSP